MLLIPLVSAMNSVRHHFVPQGYLRGFSCPLRGRQFVWVYDKRVGRAPTCKSVRSIAWAPAYYAQERSDGTLDTDTLETELAIKVDTKVAELIAGFNPQSSCLEINDEQRGLLAFFIGLSLTRVPSFRDGVRDLYSQIAQHTAEVIAPQIWTGPGPIPQFKAEAKEWVTLEHMIQGAQQISESLLAKDWQFFRTSADISFITSDNPVVFNGMAPASPDCEILMTLTKRLSIVCGPRRSGAQYRIFQAPKPQVKSMNAAVAKAARTRIFAGEHLGGLERLAKKYSHSERKVSVG